MTLLTTRWDSSNGTASAESPQFQPALLVPHDKLVQALTHLIVEAGVRLLHLDDDDRDGSQYPNLDKHPDLNTLKLFAEDPEFQYFVDRLHYLGLWAVAAEKAMAIAADDLLERLVLRVCNTRSRLGKENTTQRLPPVWAVLKDFVSVYFRGLVASIPVHGRQSLDVDWLELANRKLARLRSREFFNLVESSTSKRPEYEDPVLQDLFVCAQRPEDRRILLDEFTMRLDRDLLQPGRSTVDILDVFVRAVHLMKLVDPHGSLLNEAAKAFRHYIQLRDDAVRIMLVNFLEGCKPHAEKVTPDWPDYSEGVANSVKTEPSFYSGDYFEGMDLRDLKWQPEPVDASNGHQATKALDDLGHLIKLAEQKTFISDLQLLFRARLLGSAGSDYVQEIDLLQLLKRRFDHDGAFQNVEVMLNDVLQSHRLLNEMVEQHKQQLQDVMDDEQGDSAPPFSIPFNAHVLSRSYWTNIEPMDFRLPPSLQTQASVFDSKYKILHEQKQLQWSKQLGHATVELELKDRTFSREVTTAQAAVIAVFSSETSDTVSMSLTDLQDTLGMDDALLRSCLAFWIAAEVLCESTSSPGTYSVLETLAPGHSTAKAAAAEASLSADPNAPDSGTDLSAAPAELKSAADLLRENGLVYGNFISALLTNQGGMPAQRIHMILANMMPGGFPFGVEDLVGFLREMATEGRIETAGGVWRIVKKK